jgi:HlyD family secretion protein
VVVLILAVIVAGFFIVRRIGRGQTAADLSDLQTAEVRRGELTATVGASGTVRANQSAVLAFGTSGTVEEVVVEVGDSVKSSQVLATLEETSLSAQVILARSDLVAAKRALEDLRNSDAARAQAQLALAQAEKALKDANYRRSVQQRGRRASSSVIEGAEANLKLADEEVRLAEEAYNQAGSEMAQALALSKLSAARQKRDSILRNLNWYTGEPSDIDQAILDGDVAVAEARLGDAQRAWERVKDGPTSDDIDAAQARVDAAQATADLALIKAPFGGTITSVKIKPGDRVSPGQMAVSLADLSRFLVDVQVTEVDVNQLAVGQPVTLAFDAVADREYRGEVTEIGLSGEVVQGVVNFDVTVVVSDADEQIRSGMTCAVNIVVKQIENVLLIPNRAVRVRDGERVVYVLQDGALQTAPVTLGASSDLESEVLEGELEEGDLIALNPPIEFEQNGPPPFVRR